MSSPSEPSPARRRRGRPRKDGKIFLHSTSRHAITKTRRLEATNPTQQQADAQNPNPKSMIGRMVHGMIEGSIDAGFFISVRMGENGAPFRGVVFQPGKFIPITSANDVASQAEKYCRNEIPFPVYNNIDNNNHHHLQSQSQTLQPFVLGNWSTFLEPVSAFPRRKVPLQETSKAQMNEATEGANKNTTSLFADIVSESSSYKATENGFHHQVYGNELKGSYLERHQNNPTKAAVEYPRNFTHRPMIELGEIPVLDQFHSVEREAIKSNVLQEEGNGRNQYEFKSPDLNFHQNHFRFGSEPESRNPNCSGSNFDGISGSPNLELDLSSNQVYHHALLSGDSLLLPADGASEPQEFMMEKSKYPMKK